MKYTYILFLTLLSMGLYSCMSTDTEIWINESGSGRSTIAIDLSDMMELTNMIIPDSIENGKPQKNTKLDTTMSFYDIAISKAEDKEAISSILKKVNIHASIDENQEDALIKIDFSYDSQEEKLNIFKELDKVKSEDNAMGTSAAMAQDTSEFSDYLTDYVLDTEAREITIEGFNLSSMMEDDPEMKEIIEDLKNPNESENPAAVAMLESLFGAEQRIIIHAPSKVKSCSVESAIIDGKSVTFKYTMIEVLKAGVFSECIIKY